jgi:hypothetical protein
MLPMLNDDDTVGSHLPIPFSCCSLFATGTCVGGTALLRSAVFSVARVALRLRQEAPVHQCLGPTLHISLHIRKWVPSFLCLQKSRSLFNKSASIPQSCPVDASGLSVSLERKYLYGPSEVYVAANEVRTP